MLKEAFYFMLAVLWHCWLGGRKGTDLSRLCTHLLVNAADGAVQVHRVGSSVCASCFSRCWCHRHVVRRQHVASAPTSLVTARRRRTTPSTDSLPRPARTTYVPRTSLSRIAICYCWKWLGSWVVSLLGLRTEGPRFKTQPQRCRVTVLGKLFTPIVSLFTNQQNW